MVKFILHTPKNSFDWIDITNPTSEDFKTLKDKYLLHEASIKDCLEIGHLPKIEEFDNYHFLILRSVPPTFDDHTYELSEVTERISVFYNENFIITVHRNEINFLNTLKQTDSTNKRLKSSKSLVNALISEALKTFEDLTVNVLKTKLEAYEDAVFLHKNRKPFLKKIYHIKRQIDVMRSILILYEDIVDYFHMPEYQNIYTQDLKDLFSKTNLMFRNTAENTAQLLSIYFNIESNHTNEIMRTLTIISVFFMPLTFIVGVYGMNFKYMPELSWKYGYIGIISLMTILSLTIYIWFKKKKWL